MNTAHLRAQFPGLSALHNGRPLTFFDGPGGTQVPLSVIHAVSDYYACRNANQGGAFATSRSTDETMQAARSAMADLLNAPSPDCIVFGPNMTTLTFQLARSFGDALKPGDEIVITDLDHDANVAPWLDLQATGAVVRVAPLNPNCTLNMDALHALIGPRTKLVAVTGASNAVGTRTDLLTIGGWARSVGAFLFVDAVQLAPHALIDVQAVDCDFLACSAYKFFGPHIGIMYFKPMAAARLKPHKVRPAKDLLPYAWETGTPNFEGMAGTAAAVNYLAEIGRAEHPCASRREALAYAFEAIGRHELELCRYLISGLQSIPGVKIYGILEPENAAQRVATVAFTWTRMTPQETSRFLAEHNICAWAGNYYAVRLMESLGLEPDGAVRIGIEHYNTSEEVEYLLKVLKSA
jgi:cysteine desulfurase family protein (TIGR01976 family)